MDIPERIRMEIVSNFPAALPSHHGKSVVFPCVRLRVVALATTRSIRIFNVELLPDVQNKDKNNDQAIMLRGKRRLPAQTSNRRLLGRKVKAEKHARAAALHKYAIRVACGYCLHE